MMKLLKHLTKFRSEKEPQQQRAASKQKSAKPAPATDRRTVSLWPMVRTTQADALKLYQAMDTAG